MRMTTAARSIALALIQRFEGCMTVPYQDPRGLWTIGWGNRSLLDGAPVTRDTKPLADFQCDELLIDTFDKRVAPRLCALIPTVLSDHESGALGSLVWNIGVTGFAHSMILRDIDHGDLDTAGRRFLEWSLIRGVHSPGLLRRRVAELHSWTTRDDTSSAT